MERGSVKMIEVHVMFKKHQNAFPLMSIPRGHRHMEFERYGDRNGIVKT